MRWRRVPHCPWRTQDRPQPKSGADGGGFLEGGLEGVGDGFFGDGEAIDTGGEAGPFGAFQGEEKFVDIVKAVCAAGEGGFDFQDDGEGAEDFGDGLIQESVGDGKKAHEEEAGLFVVHARGVGEFFAEVRAGQRGADKFRRFAGGKGDDSEDGDPAAEFAFAKKGEGVADAVNFRAQAEERGIEITKQAIEERRFVLEKFLDGSVVEVGCGDEIEQAELKELVAGDLAGFDHGGLAEEVALEIGVAKPAGFGEFGFSFDFFSEEGDAGFAVFFDDAAAAVGIENLEVDFEVLGAFDERGELGVVDEIVEGEGIAGVDEVAADFGDFV